MNYSNKTDEEILRCIKGDFKDGIDEIMDRYKKLVKIKARSYFLIGSDEDDIIQEGMIGLYKAIRDYKEGREAKFKTFANICIDRQIQSAIKMATRNKHMPLNNYISIDKNIGDFNQTYSIVDYLGDTNFQPELMVIDKERRDDIKSAIKTELSEMEKEVLRMYLNGYKYEDISNKTGIKQKAIDNALQRVKNKLRKTKKIFNK